MQPIIRRTIKITIIETWTIIGPDGHETTWQTSEEVIWPDGSVGVAPRPMLSTADDDRSDDQAVEQMDHDA